MSEIATAETASVSTRLAEYFDPSEVKFLPKIVKGNRALAMAYVDARVIMDRLDDVVGPENWSDEYAVHPDGCVSCKLTIRFGERMVTKQDVGAPSAQPDAGDRLKAAHSDALKRAAVKFGVGRYLYAIPSFWAEYDAVKKQWNGKPQLPAAFRPQGVTTTVQQKPQQHLPPAQSRPANGQPNQLPAANQPKGKLCSSEEFQALTSGINNARSWPELQAAMFAVKAMKDKGGLSPGALDMLTKAAEEMLRKYPNPNPGAHQQRNAKPAASRGDVETLIAAGEAAFGGEGFDGWLMGRHQLTRNALGMLAADEVRKLADAIGDEISQANYPDNHEHGGGDEAGY